jgi:2-C-methyl-D-erythritol 4-phosphate cytidylyltransferase
MATDDAVLVERLGNKIKLYMGSYDNIKITTPGDLALAGILLKGGG